MSSSKQTKFSGTKAAGISILALCLLAFSQLLALLIGNKLGEGVADENGKYAGGRRNVSGDRKYFHWNFICGSGTWRSLSDL